VSTLEPIPPTIVWYPIFQNGVTFICVSYTTFIFNYCKLIMGSPHFYIANVHLIILAYSFYVSTPFGLMFLDLVFPFKWSEIEFKIMFHILLALFKECVIFSITSIAISNVYFYPHTFLTYCKGLIQLKCWFFVFSCKLRRHIFLVCCLHVQHVDLLPLRHNQVCDCFVLPNANIEELNDVCFG